MHSRGVVSNDLPPLPFPAILISIGSLSIYQMTVAALCRAQRDIGLEPQRKKNKNPDAGKLAWYRQPLHFPSPSEEDGHNRLPDNTRTHRARSSRFFFFNLFIELVTPSPVHLLHRLSSAFMFYFQSCLSLTTRSFLSLPSSVSPMLWSCPDGDPPYPSLPPPTNLPLPHCLGGSLKCHLLCSLLYLGECCQIVTCITGIFSLLILQFLCVCACVTTKK